MIDSLPDSGEIYSGDLRELVWEDWDDRTTDPYIYCPKHPDERRPSMRVYRDGAKCWTCGAFMGRADFSALFDSMHKTSAKLLARPAPPKRISHVDPVVLTKASNKMLMSNPDKMEYLRHRGLDDLTIYEWKLGHNGPAYTIPVFDPMDGPNSPPITVRFRRDDKEWPDGPNKYWGLPGNNDTYYYGHILIPGFDHTLVMTEGELDALLLIQHRLPAFSLTNGCRAGDNLKWAGFLKDIDTLVLMRDQDQAGRKATATLCEKLHAAYPQLKLVPVAWQAPFKDVTEVWQEDPELFDRYLRLVRRVVSGREI